MTDSRTPALFEVNKASVRSGTSVRRAGRRAGVYLAYGALALLVLFPLSWALLGAFKSSSELFAYPPSFWPRRPSFDAIAAVLRGSEFPRYIGNTVIVTGCSVLLTLLFGALAAYAFSRWHFAWKEPLLVVLLALQLIPSTVNVVPYYLIMSRLGLLNSLTGLVIIYTAQHLPLCIWVLKNFFDTVPSSLDEAASIDGSSKLRTFVSVILPLSLPGLSVAAVLTFISCWAEFLVPFVVARSRETAVVSVGLYNYFAPEGTPVNALLAATVVSVAPVVLAYLFAQRYLVAGLTSHVEK